MSELYNTIMPETTDRALCIQVDKPISAKGYDENFTPRIDAMIKQYGEVRLLVYYKHFQGWEEEAAKGNMAELPKYSKVLRKMALVNPPRSELFKNKIKQPVLSGETRVFNENELADALAWIHED
jgi:SpoIIAA-like